MQLMHCENFADILARHGCKHCVCCNEEQPHVQRLDDCWPAQLTSPTAYFKHRADQLRLQQQHPRVISWRSAYATTLSFSQLRTARIHRSTYYARQQLQHLTVLIPELYTGIPVEVQTVEFVRSYAVALNNTKQQAAKDPCRYATQRCPSRLPAPAAAHPPYPALPVLRAQGSRSEAPHAPAAPAQCWGGGSLKVRLWRASPPAPASAGSEAMHSCVSSCSSVGSPCSTSGSSMDCSPLHREGSSQQQQQRRRPPQQQARPLHHRHGTPVKEVVEYGSMQASKRPHCGWLRHPLGWLSGRSPPQRSSPVSVLPLLLSTAQ